MEIILFCDSISHCIPGNPMPEALVPYCNVPLIVRILRFLSTKPISGITLCRAGEGVRRLCGEMQLPMPLAFADAPHSGRSPVLLFRRPCLPEWDFGELRDLCRHSPVRLCHPDGSDADIWAFPANAPIRKPERMAIPKESRFPHADTPEEYLYLQQTLLTQNPELQRIGEGVQLGTAVQLSSNTIIGHHCLIGDHAVLEDCCLGDGVQIGAHTVLRGCVIGGQALIDRRAELTGEAVPAHAVRSAEMQFSGEPPLTLHPEDGICRGLPRWNSISTALQAGAAMAAIGRRIAIGWNHPSGKAMALSAAAGASSQGASAFLAGECALSQLITVGGCTQADAMLWLCGDSVVRLQPRTAGGFALDSAQAHCLQTALSANTAQRIQPCSAISDVSGLQGLWEEGIRSLLLETSPIVEISCSNSALRERAQRLFTGKTGERIVLSLSEDGTRVSAYTNASGMIRHEQLLLLSLLSLREMGENLAVPAQFHPAAEDFAAQYGSRILRVHSKGASPHAAQCLVRQGLWTDGIRLFAHILRILHKRQLTLQGAAALLPPMYTENRYIPTSLDSNAVRRLYRSHPDPRVYITHLGRLARLCVHAQSMETAAELCTVWEKRLCGEPDHPEHPISGCAEFL